MYCPFYTRVAWLGIGTKEAVAVRLRCKRWSCDYCAKKNAAIWRAHLKQRLPEVCNEWWILTLTAPPWARTTAQSLKAIRKGIDILIKRAKRVFGPMIDYVRVYEKHPTSEAVHSHFIISGLSPYVAIGYSAKLQPMAIGVLNRAARNGIWAVKTWFKKVCQEIKLGQQVDVQKIDGDPEKATMYVTGYLTKAMQDIKIKGLRHVQTTRRVGGPKHDKNPNWQTGPYLTPYAFDAGTRVIDLNTGEIIDNNYWEVHSFWPYD